VIPMDTPFGVVDYERKRREIAPRQTVSLCMILKNGESTIRKALSSVIDYVDEVIIGVDKATTDRTRAVLASLAEDNPHKPFTVFDGEPAVEAGFDAARNATIDKASGDWIMWMDADEELSGADNIDRIVQPSSNNAYGTPQIHYATQPAQVLTTDYPCRLFRNRRGVKFFGLVHEHPEEAPGKSIQFVAVLPDVMFAHYGYINESIRRKRFQRNYPLLLRDIAKYPDRILNKFLFLRDIAQGIGFEREQGVFSQDQVQQAQRGCELFGEIVNMGHTRMIVDALPFYTICVETLGEGFEAEFAIASTKPHLPEMSYAVRAKSRFRNEADYLKIITKLAQESITNYDSRYA
jgi:glycosyltransferase involved in cell wall biosynthesis